MKTYYSDTIQIRQVEEESSQRTQKAIITHVKKLDKVCTRIDRGLITKYNLNRVYEVLCEPIRLEGLYKDYTVSLNKPEKLRSCLWRIDDALLLEVRKVHHLPRYAFYRKYRRVLVEELFKSNMFPEVDKRLFSYTNFGQRRYALKLFEFRKSIGGSNRKKDRLLSEVGKLLQYAWHEDTRLIYLLGNPRALNLTNSIHLVEIFYVICFRYWEEKSNWSKGALWFFECHYPNPHMHSILCKLQETELSEKIAFENLVMDIFMQFHADLAKFLNTEIKRGKYARPVDLGKLLYANYNRFAGIVELMALREDARVKKAVKKLEKVAEGMIGELVMTLGG